MLEIAKAYAKAKGLALSTVSKRFHGADTFLEDFADGRCSVTLRKFDSMVKSFEANWPDDAKFPVMTLGKNSVVSGKRQRH